MQIKKNLMLAFLLIFILNTNISLADHKPTLEYEGLNWSQLPVVCGSTESINEYLVHNKFILENLSVGKEGSRKNGMNVFMVSYFINNDKTESIAVLTSPSALESCMMYRSFELVFPGIGT